MDNVPRRLETLYQEVGPDLLAYLRRRHRSPETAEDLLQETFAFAVSRMDRLFQATSPRAYLFGIARNLSVDFYRRSRPTEELPAEIGDKAAPEVEPAVLAMREAIHSLPEQHREVLEMRLQHELSYEEIAQALQIPIGTVRSRLHHAVLKLRQTMKAMS